MNKKQKLICPNCRNLLVAGKKPSNFVYAESKCPHCKSQLIMRKSKGLEIECRSIKEVETKLELETIYENLKPEEQIIFDLLHQGYNIREIAKELGISEFLVNKNLRWIRVKLGA